MNVNIRFVNKGVQAGAWACRNMNIFGNECHIFISYPEELVCAYASSAKVKETFHSLRQVQGEISRLGKKPWKIILTQLISPQIDL